MTAGMRSLLTAADGGIGLGGVKRELKGTIRREHAWCTYSIRASISPNFEGVFCLSKRQVGMRCLVRVGIPNNTRGSSGNNAIGWTNRVGVSIFTDSRNGEVSRGGQDVTEVPSECNELVLSNLVIRSGLLGRLSDSENASRS